MLKVGRATLAAFLPVAVSWVAPKQEDDYTEQQCAHQNKIHAAPCLKWTEWFDLGRPV